MIAVVAPVPSDRALEMRLVRVVRSAAGRFSVPLVGAQDWPDIGPDVS
jgi:hypothetical protein